MYNCLTASTSSARLWTVAAVLAATCSVGADTIVLHPSKDNTIYGDATGSLSNGAGQFLFAGKNGRPWTQRALLAFAISDSIASGASIASVRLTLNMSRTSTGPETIALHRTLADWGEGTSTADRGEGSGVAATAGDATWIHTFFDTRLWDTAGGDFATDPSASLEVNAVDSYTWESTPQLVADVQAWLDEPASNFGWILIGNEDTASTSKRFGSRHRTNPEERPTLTVEFEIDATEKPLLGDFDDDGSVGFQDFFLFADHFGSSKEMENWDARFDLAADGNVGFADFFIFADSFGATRD